ncbi:MAG TPA: hypothetical protein DDZ51_11230 [Planctomycetaceae bacterium]|nr:hypothetical protein [Planctomycetaceae bacterium]
MPISPRVHTIVSRYMLIADTCFVLNENFEDFVNHFRGELGHNPLRIPKKVWFELERLAQGPANKSQQQAGGNTIAKRAEQAQRLIVSLDKEGLATVCESPLDDRVRTADQVISSLVEQFLTLQPMVVLTCDRKLKDWIHQKRSNGCFGQSKSLFVIRFSPHSGLPVLWRSQATHSQQPTAVTQATTARGIRNGSVQTANGGHGYYHTAKQSPGNRIAQHVGIANGQAERPSCRPTKTFPAKTRPFDVATKITSSSQVPVPGLQSLQAGESVYDSHHKPVVLEKQLGSGGEGVVFQTDRPGIVCKIYHCDRITPFAEEKIRLMVSRPIKHSAICWPAEIISDKSGQFRGFLMPTAAGQSLAETLFLPAIWTENQPNWTRRESVALAIAILDVVAYLHRFNILIGDINPANILITPAGRVQFVDCDSYQIEGFPCPVGSVDFVAPEIQGQNFGQFLRTPEHELFAVATLLFMIMLPGKAPYSHQGGSNGADNIRAMHFPYNLNARKEGPGSHQGSNEVVQLRQYHNVPQGAWRYCWSHLSPRIKADFHQCFHADNRHFPRVTLGQWRRSFQSYQLLLADEQKVFVGPQAQLGFDLCILPQNKRYCRDANGNVLPHRIPRDGKTDMQRAIAQVIRKLTQGETPAPATSAVSTSTSNGSTNSAKPSNGAKKSRSTAKSPNTATASKKTTSRAASTASTATAQPGSGNTVQTGSASAATPSATTPICDWDEWYEHPLVWPVVVVGKFAAEVLGAGLVGTFALGFVGMLVGFFFGSATTGALGGAYVGASLGAIAGVIGAICSVKETLPSIFPAAGLGLATGGGLGWLLSGGPLMACAGGCLGMLVGLAILRLIIDQCDAENYLKTVWGDDTLFF